MHLTQLRKLTTVPPANGFSASASETRGSVWVRSRATRPALPPALCPACRRRYVGRSGSLCACVTIGVTRSDLVLHRHARAVPAVVPAVPVTHVDPVVPVVPRLFACLTVFLRLPLDSSPTSRSLHSISSTPSPRRRDTGRGTSPAGRGFGPLVLRSSLRVRGGPSLPHMGSLRPERWVPARDASVCIPEQ